jgi:hypothetical protein
MSAGKINNRLYFLMQGGCHLRMPPGCTITADQGLILRALKGLVILIICLIVAYADGHFLVQNFLKYGKKRGACFF